VDVVQGKWTQKIIMISAFTHLLEGCRFVVAYIHGIFELVFNNSTLQSPIRLLGNITRYNKRAFTTLPELATNVRSNDNRIHTEELFTLHQAKYEIGDEEIQ